MSEIEIEKRFKELIEECDRLIKSGQISTVASRLDRLPHTKIPDSVRQPLAHICRRAGLLSRGLRLLYPLVRGEMSKQNPPRIEEICEYAVLLSRNGSTQEALALLEEVSDHSPTVLFSLAYCYIALWEYPKVVEILQKLLQLDVDDYTSLIARVNLCSAYLAISNFSDALTATNETIELAQNKGASRLLANCLEMRAQIHFRANHFDLVRKDLAKAQEILGPTRVHDQLLVFQLQSMMLAMETHSIEPLLEFRKEAIARKIWPSVREIDLFTVKFRFDQKLLDQLYFGTPMPGYRERIEKEIDRAPSEHYIFGTSSKPLLDLEKGHLINSNIIVIENKIHQTFVALTRDLYVPRSLGSLFSELYPGEYFDLNSSPLRVRQLLTRARKFLNEHQLPATIEHQDGRYHLSIQGSFGVRLGHAEQMGSPSSLKWMQLTETYPTGISFTAVQACKDLNWTRSSFRRTVDSALETGHLIKTGVGKSTTYQVIDPKRSHFKTKSQKDPSAA